VRTCLIYSTVRTTCMYIIVPFYLYINCTHVRIVIFGFSRRFLLPSRFMEDG
jgi:hypothetical protein